MSLRFAMVTDTHVGLPPSGLAERLSLVYAAIAGLAPDFVLHCGDITDTGLPGEYDRYQAAVPAALRGRIRHVPGNHEVRWDPTAKELYRARFGAVPYSFDAGGVHFAAFDLTQPLLEPGHCGMAGLDWLARDLGALALGTPALLFQHFPVGGGHDFVDDQTALLELMARHDVRGLFAGHVHRETVTQLDGLTQLTLRAVRDEAVFYWADLADGPALAVSRVTVSGGGALAGVPVARVPLSGRRPPRAGAAPQHRFPAAPGLPRPQWRVRLNGSVQGGIAVAGSAVVAASTGGDIAAFRAGPGPGDRGIAWLWRARTGPVYRRPGVDRAARTLFVPSADRHLYALDAATGLIRWRFAAGAPVLSEPLAVADGPDGYVVFAAGDRLLAVEASAGRLAWSVPGRGFSAGRAACDGERVYTAAADGYARAHDLRTGREAWSYPMVSGDPHRVALYSGWDDVVMVGAGVVLVATVSGSQALEAATGTPRWTFPGSTMYPPAVFLGDGTALLATEQGVVSRVSLDDGGAVWQASLGTRLQNAGLAVAGDSAWAVSAVGWLVRVRLADGDLAGSVRLTRAHCYSAPAVVGGTLITGDQDGLVHGIRLAGDEACELPAASLGEDFLHSPDMVFMALPRPSPRHMPTRKRLIRSFQDPGKGRMTAHGIAVSKQAAASEHLALGSPVRVTFVSNASKTYTVQVIYSVRDLTGDYILPLAAAKAYFAQALDADVFVKLAPGVSAAAGRHAIGKVLASYPNATLQDQVQYKAQQAQQVNQLLNLVYGLLALAIIIALIGIANTLALSVHERTRELGLLRAVGTTRGQLRSIVRAEALIISLFGALEGLLLGMIFGWAIVAVLRSRGVTTLVFPAGQLSATAGLAGLAGLAGVVAAIGPSRRAARLDILRAVTTE